MSAHDAKDPTGGMTRRDLIAILGSMTAGAFFVPSLAEATEAHRIAGEAIAAAGGTFAPKHFTAAEYRTVQMLVDYIIPRDRVSGSATDAGVPEFMDTMLGLEPRLVTQHRAGLAWLDEECTKRWQKPFVDCSDGERRFLLGAIAFPARAAQDVTTGVRWFNAFRDFTASGFYTSQIGIKDIGFMGNVGQAEWRGCPPENYRRLGV